MDKELITLDVEKSLFKPIVIKVRDADKKLHTFYCRKLVRSVMRKHYDWANDFQEASKNGDFQKIDDLVYAHLAFLFEIPEKDLDNFEADEIGLALDSFILRLARRKIEKTNQALDSAKKAAAPDMPNKTTVKRRPAKKKK